MKNLVKIALLTTSLISTAAYGGGDSKTSIPSTSKETSVKLTDTSVVAEYDGKKVTVKDIMKELKEIFDNQPSMKGKNFQDLDKQMQENVVKGYVHSKLVEKEIASSHIEDSKEFKEKLSQAKTQIAQQLFVENKIKSKITDSTILAEYEKMKKELVGKEEVKASHILVEKEETAKEVKAKLDKGSKFSDLAKEYSSDEGSKSNGGELGYFSKGQLVPEFENSAFSMKKGQISDPIKSQFGWHIIKVEDKRPIKVPTLEEAKPSIQAKLSREVFEEYLKELDKKSNLKLML